MKKILFILVAFLAFSCCSSKLTEKVEVAFPNGQPQIVRYYDRKGICVKQTEYYESGQVDKMAEMKVDAVKEKMEKAQKLAEEKKQQYDELTKEVREMLIKVSKMVEDRVSDNEDVAEEHHAFCMDVNGKWLDTVVENVLNFLKE